jgi:hypothetical protein
MKDKTTRVDEILDAHKKIAILAETNIFLRELQKKALSLTGESVSVWALKNIPSTRPLTEQAIGSILEHFDYLPCIAAYFPKTKALEFRSLLWKEIEGLEKKIQDLQIQGLKDLGFSEHETVAIRCAADRSGDWEADKDASHIWKKWAESKASKMISENTKKREELDKVLL